MFLFRLSMMEAADLWQVLCAPLRLLLDAYNRGLPSIDTMAIAAIASPTDVADLSAHLARRVNAGDQVLLVLLVHTNLGPETVIPEP
jgi:hypothetical protein